MRNLSFFHILPVILVTILFCSEIYGSSPWLTKHHRHELNITSQPSPADWQRFHKLSESERHELWSYYRQLGHDLKDWSWEWRLGWIRRCSESNEAFCQDILEAGLQDPALLVRGETASAFGRRYAGSRNRQILELLASAFKDKRNYRHNEPLIVPARILYAIHLIGGSHAERLGKNLASDHPENTAYWRKIARVGN